MEKFLINKRKDCDPDENAINSQGKKIKLDMPVPSRNLVTKWCSLYKWLEVEWSEDKSPLFKCKFCVTAKKKKRSGK